MWLVCCLAVFVCVHPIFTTLLCNCVICQQLYKNFNHCCGSRIRAYIIILEQGNIIALQQCIGALVHFCNSAFLQWCFSALMHHGIIALIHWCINSLVHQYISAIIHWCIGALTLQSTQINIKRGEYHSTHDYIGALMYCCLNLLVNWCTGKLMNLYIGTLLYWCINTLVY